MRLFLILSLVLSVSYAFGTDPAVLENWQKTMKFGISSQRSAVIKAIGDNKSADAYDLIKEAMLNDVNAEIRGIAAYALIDLKIDEDALWGKALSGEKDPDILRKVVFGVSELKIKSAGPRLFVILTNNVNEPKQEALSSSTIRALGAIDYKPAADKVLSILTNIDMSPEVRGSAAIAIGELGSGKYLGILRGLLENIGESSDVRMYSSYAIGRSGDALALDILTPYIENEKEDLNIRLWAISGLSYVNSPKVPAMLIRYSKVDNIRIRLEAVKSLGKLKSAEATEILKYKAVYDPDMGVRREAKTALQALGVDVEKLVQEAAKPKEKTPVAPTVSTNAKPAEKTVTAPVSTTTSVPVTNKTAVQPAATNAAPLPDTKKKTK